MMSALPFRFVGHPMVDVGVATLCAAAEVDDPSQLTAEALDRFVQEMVELYLNPTMSGFLTYVVFAGARFANPALIKNPKFLPKRRAILSEAATLWKPNALAPLHEDFLTTDEACVFSGDPAVVRVSRVYIPLITDESKINFVPEGVPRLPIAGWCLLALLAMPMGGLASRGKMWIVHSYDSAATLHFAKVNLARNRQDFQMEGLSKRPNYRFARTYLIRDLLTARAYNARYPLTTYTFTSSGQKSEVDIDHLTSPVLRFISLARRQVPSAWERIVRRAEHLNAQPENKDGAIIYHDRNYFYEDLFNLPAEARRFLRLYILRTPFQGKPSGEAKNDPRYTYSLEKESDLVSWELTTLFLREVIGMDAERIEAIKQVGDRVADYIQTRDERLFKHLFSARNESLFRLALLKADKDAPAPLFTLDEFVLAFFTTTDQDVLRSDWQLARDLMLIRIIEKLHESGRVEIAQRAVIEEDEAASAAQA